MIQPFLKKIQIEIEKPVAGGLDLSSKETGTENGKVIAIGSEVKGIKVGDTLLFKSWQLDVVSYNGENIYFLDSDGIGICAIINQ